MTRRWTVLLGALFLGVAIPTRDLVAQKRDTTDRVRPPAFSLGQNYPNPFSSDTRIPFTIGDPATCRDVVKTFRVSLRVYNLLSQSVAVPTLVGGPGTIAGGQPLEAVPLPCGTYLAYWDGQYASTKKEAPPSIYLYRIEVEGAVAVKKMVITR
jgi:hypothetical protein